MSVVLTRRADAPTGAHPRVEADGEDNAVAAPFQCNSGAAAVILHTRGAHLLS